MTDAAKRLWAAVLDQAIKDSQADKPGHNSHESIIAEGARAWFSSKSQEDGSFLWVCDILGIDPEAVQNYIAFMAEDQTCLPISAVGSGMDSFSHQECRSF